MTTDKRLKRAARMRARSTGESYTAARYRLLAPQAKENLMELQLRQVTNTALGFALAIPTDWEEMPPRPNTREVFSAMSRPNGRTFVVVSKMLAKTAQLRDDVSLDAWVDHIAAGLVANSGALDLGRSPRTLGDRQAVQLDYRFEAGRESLTTRAIWTLRAPAAFMLAFGTDDLAGSEAVIETITASFALV